MADQTMIQFKDNYGIERTFVMEGDFYVGRVDDGDTSNLVFKDAEGNGTRIMSCDRSISRKHARFFWNRGKLHVQDLGSVNGTYVNGHPLEGWEKKTQSRPLHLPGRVEVTFAKEFLVSVEPIEAKGEMQQYLEQAGVKPGSPVVINIDHSKHIGSMDIVANRSQLVIDSDEDPDNTDTQEIKRRRKKEDEEQ
jgi:hypothetical protein